MNEPKFLIKPVVDYGENTVKAGVGPGDATVRWGVFVNLPLPTSLGISKQQWRHAASFMNFNDAKKYLDSLANAQAKADEPELHYYYDKDGFRLEEDA